MSKIKNDGLDQYDAGPFEQQQFGTAGIEGDKLIDWLIGWLIDSYSELLHASRQVPQKGFSKQNSSKHWTNEQLMDSNKQ